MCPVRHGPACPYGMHTSQIYLLYQAHTAMQERYGGSAERLLTSEKTLALPGNLPGTAKRSSGCDITCVHPVGTRLAMTVSTYGRLVPTDLRFAVESV